MPMRSHGASASLPRHWQSSVAHEPTVSKDVVMVSRDWWASRPVGEGRLPFTRWQHEVLYEPVPLP